MNDRILVLNKPDISTLLLKFGLGIFYFLFLYSIQFIFVPAAIGTRVFMGLAGVMILGYGILKNLREGNLKVDADMFRIIACLLSIGVVSLITNLINGTTERAFFSYIVSMSMILFAAYFIMRITALVYGRENVTFELISKYVIGTVVAQMCISVIMFLIPPFRDLIIGIQYQFDYSLTLFDLSEGVRLIGFGSQFFGAGITNGFALILIGALMRTKNPPISHGWLTFFFILITLIGSMMARTTLVGTVMGLFLMIWDSRLFRLKITKRLRIIIRSLLLLILIGIIGFQMMPLSTQDTFETALEYGFEMFVNYTETGKMSTASTDYLIDMYEVYPTDVPTWIIGNGLWYSDPSDPLAYAAGVDVGHTRLIFYFGLIGLLIYFTYQWSLLLMLKHKIDKQYLLFILLLFVYVVILNFKGFADIIQYVAIYLFIPNNKFVQCRECRS